MIRNSAKMTAAAVVVLLGGAGAINCTKSNTSDSTMGHVSLALMIGADEIDTVAYDIKAGAPTGIADVTGSINTSDKNATASVEHSFPASTGDVVTLTATTTGGVHCTGTSLPFAVTSGNTASVSVALVCGSGSSGVAPGTVVVNGTVTNNPSCPAFTSYSASPLQTSVGGTIDVAGAAVDADSSTLTYAWAPAANFGNAAAQTTKYSCTTAGTQTFTLTVSSPTSGACLPTTTTFTVNCVAVSICGDGVVGPGEQCDPPNGTTCSASCQTISSTGAAGAGAAGAGVAGAGAAGAGAAGAGAAGAGAAGAGAAGAGAAGAGAAGAGAAGAGAAGAGAAGAGAAGAGAAGAGAAGAGAAGSGAAGVSACESCEISNTTAQNCFSTSTTANAGTTDPTKFGCNGFAGADLTECNNLLSCIRTKGCAVGDDATACLCGALNPTACASTAVANLTGACVPQYVAASDGGNVFSLFFSTDSPIGVANNLFTCDIDSSCTCP